MRLADFAENEYSQFGEDGIIAKIFSIIGEQSRFCVEFGASDGTSCSNTKALREQGWEGLLVESDPKLFGVLQSEVKAGVNTQNVEVTAGNINHIIGRYAVDFISIDVDGTDYDIWEAMQAKPRLVCIEYNASIPPHVSIHQKTDGLGSSAKALCELAASKDYILVSLTKGNLFFVEKEYEQKFAEYERDLEILFDRSWLCYYATDYHGKGFVVGAVPPWGMSNEPFVGETEGDSWLTVTSQPEVLRAGFEALYGEAKWIPSDAGIDSRLGVEVPDAHRMNILITLLRDNKGLVLIDISNHTKDAKFDWITQRAENLGYCSKVIPAGVIALFPI